MVAATSLRVAPQDGTIPPSKIFIAEVPMPYLAAALAAGALVLFIIGRTQSSKARYIQSTEASRAGELVQAAADVAKEIGPGSFTKLTELNGQVECATPLRAEISEEPCVWYRSTVTREYEEHYQEKDSDGRTHTRTRRGSEVVSKNERGQPFLLRDDSGAIEVDPSGAKLDGDHVVSRFEPANGGNLVLGSLRLDLGSMLGMGGRRTLGYRLEEWAIPLGKRLYVIGEVVDSEGRLHMRKPKDGKKRFIISVKDEEEILKGARGLSLGLTIGAAVLLVGAAILAILVFLGILQ
jgi:hypothetical protein